MQIEIAALPQVSGRQPVALRRLPRGIVRGGRGEIPWTHILADVATIRMIADLRPLRFGDWAIHLDGQVRDAFGSVQHAGVDNRAGWTGVDADRAGAALIEAGRVRLEREIGCDAGEEKIRALLAVDEAGVLADPAKAGVLGVDALLNVMLVDEDLGIEGVGQLTPHPFEQRLQ